MLIPFPGSRSVEVGSEAEEESAESAWSAPAEELARQHRLAELGLLSAGLAHQLRHTLTALVGLSEVLLGALPESGVVEARREALLLRRECLRGMRLVRLLLEYVQPPAGLAREPVLVEEVIDDAAALWRLQRTPGAVRLERAPVTAGLRVAGPGLLLQQVLLNLFANASEAIAGAGREGAIRVAVWRREGRVVLEVADDGPGIPADRQARLFEPMAVAAPGHTGLGLSLCRWLVGQLGGEIFLRHSQPGQTAFQIELPLLDSAADQVLPPPRLRLLAAPAPERLSLQRRPQRVLVIEDEPAVVEFLRVAFRRRGDRVSAVSRLSQARRVLLRSHWDLILLDWRAGEECASSLLYWLERQRPDLIARVLLLSGDLSPELLDCARHRGLFWLEKPFSLDELWQVVGKFFVVTEENSSHAA